MSSLLTDDQQLIQRSARDFARDRLPTSHLRELRDRRDELGYDPARWREMAQLGFAGALVPEPFGGTGLGFADLGLVLEECGRTLAPVPLLSTAAIGASAIFLGGDEATKLAHLPALASGEHLCALAHDEGTRHTRTRVRTRAIPQGDGYRIEGEKEMVLDGHVADAFIVTARVSGADDDPDGIGVFLVPARAAGVRVDRRFLVDGRSVARVQLGALDTCRKLAGPDLSEAGLLDAILDRACVALAAEMLGGILETFERTIAYLKERRQFGVPIGSFQALKHRAARLFCEIELTKSIVWDALRAVDRTDPDLPRLAATAKARASDTYLAVTNEAVQMHGGIGVTDELDIGLFLKRARVAAMTFGDGAFHRDRFARLSGF